MSSSNVSSVTKHFSTVNEGFTTTTSGPVLSGATTIPLNTVSGLSNGTVFVGIIEPGVADKEQTFTGTVDTGGLQITGVVWTRGSNTSHATSSIIVDYVTGTDHNIMSKGMLVSHNQDGTLKTNAVATTNITDSNVTTAKIADSNVTTAKIADSNVTTAKIAASAVTSAKLAPTFTAGNAGGDYVMQQGTYDLGTFKIQTGSVYSGNGIVGWRYNNVTFDVPFTNKPQVFAQLVGPNGGIETEKLSDARIANQPTTTGFSVGVYHSDSGYGGDVLWLAIGT